jgi:hypothetical protein
MRRSIEEEIDCSLSRRQARKSSNQKGGSYPEKQTGKFLNDAVQKMGSQSFKDCDNLFVSVYNYLKDPFLISW